jgi:hypothetical protein
MTSDLYTAYEQGLQRLLDHLGADHPERGPALVLEARLRENIERARRYGDPETNRAERAVLLEQLNGLGKLPAPICCGRAPLSLRRRWLCRSTTCPTSRRCHAARACRWLRIRCSSAAPRTCARSLEP